MIDIQGNVIIGGGILIGDFSVFVNDFVTEDDVNLISETGSQFIEEQ